METCSDLRQALLVVAVKMFRNTYMFTYLSSNVMYTHRTHLSIVYTYLRVLHYTVACTISGIRLVTVVSLVLTFKRDVFVYRHVMFYMSSLLLCDTVIQSARSSHSCVV